MERKYASIALADGLHHLRIYLGIQRSPPVSETILRVRCEQYPPRINAQIPGSARIDQIIIPRAIATRHGPAGSRHPGNGQHTLIGRIGVGFSRKHDRGTIGGMEERSGQVFHQQRIAGAENPLQHRHARLWIA
ncbi:hypothetical protein SAMN04489709_10736 [Paracidovorax citrulli]|nr:hypothetical protein SAMN04489709_10736 [Paracidovorax citrulli]